MIELGEVTKRRALIVQPSLQPPGGGQAVAAWMIQALKDAYEIVLVGWTPPDFDVVNRAYGTSIQGRDVEVHTLSPVLRAFVDALPVRGALLKWALLIRLARRVMRPSDLLISAENEADFGRPGIQYVHYPRQLRPRPLVDLRWYHRPAAVLDLYYAICDRLTGFTMGGVRQNLTLANSAWTAKHIRALNPDVAVTVLPPPVASSFPDVPWERRGNDFICIGRFSPEKELEKVVAILAEVRRAVPGVELHLVGGRESWSYYRRVRRLVRENASWVHLHEQMPRSALHVLVASQRYGIHGMREEHFGIAPAEMVRGGCIVFVPDGGGQVDIVGGDPRLTYATPEEAVAKIIAVLSDPSEQAALRTFLAARKDMFSAETFMHSVRRIIRSFDAAHGGPVQ